MYLTVYPNHMFVHYWRNFKNMKFFCDTRHREIESPLLFLKLSPSQCVSKPNVGALRIPLRLTGIFLLSVWQETVFALYVRLVPDSLADHACINIFIQDEST